MELIIDWVFATKPKEHGIIMWFEMFCLFVELCSCLGCFYGRIRKAMGSALSVDLFNKGGGVKRESTSRPASVSLVLAKEGAEAWINRPKATEQMAV